MLSKNELKKLKSFARKKQRDEAGVFIAEGPKLVAELMPAFQCRTLVGTAEYFRSAPPAPALFSARYLLLISNHAQQKRTQKTQILCPQEAAR